MSTDSNQNGESAESVTTLSDMSDQDILIQYCLMNKVNKTVIDKLLKRGFDNLDALKLVKLDDLSSQNIPMGQRRLIVHIAQALQVYGTTSGHSFQSSSVTTATPAENTGVSQLRLDARDTSGLHSNQSEVISLGNTGVSQALTRAELPLGQSQDVYSQTLLNTFFNFIIH